VNLHRLGRFVAAAGSAALVLTFVTVAPAQAVVVCATLDDPSAPTTITLTDDGSDPIPTASSLGKTAIIVSTTSVPVNLSITTTDDCLGADRLQARFQSTTGATKVVNLNYNYDLSDLGPNDESIDVWDATLRFTNLDRGTWYLKAATFTSITGSAVLDFNTGEPITDSTTVGAPTTVPLPTFKRIFVNAYTLAAVNATPEPAFRGRTLNVYASTMRAEGKTFVANKYAPIQIQYKAPGQGAWRVLKSTTVDRFGKASASFKPGAKGSWSFRTVAPARAGIAPSISGTDTVLVK